MNINSGESFLTTHPNLDQSTTLSNQVVISGGSISNTGFITCQGLNDQTIEAGNDQQSALGIISSSGLIASAATAYASSDALSLAQNTNALGQSEIETYGQDSSISIFQKAGVLSGGLASAQSISLDGSSILSSQVSSIAGALAYTDAATSSPAETVKATGGLNGVGTVQGQLKSDGLNIQGNADINSLESNAYSAVKIADDYSYASSGDRLSSIIDSSADVIQQSTGNIETYSNNDLSSTNEVIPTPGSWVWGNFGGYINSNPSVVQDDKGTNYCFAKGGDNSLYFLTGNDWYGLGGYLTSDPSAVKDSQGRIHTLVRGGDGSLWDNLFFPDSWTYDWYGLGGYITSDPSAALTPFTYGRLKIAVRGGDSALWIRDLDPGDMSGSWCPQGGYIISNPKIIIDSQKNFEVFAKDGNNALWVLKGTLGDDGNYLDYWHPLGGYLTTDAKPMIDPRYPNCINIVARGGDGNLWGNVLDVTTGANNWYGLNIPISGSGSIYKGNPEPMADGDGNIHVFYRGNDGALWDAVGAYKPSENRYYFNSYSLGGYITSDPAALWDKNTKQIKVAARGGDGGLWASIIG